MSHPNPSQTYDDPLPSKMKPPHTPTLGETLDKYGEAYVNRAVNAHEKLIDYLKKEHKPFTDTIGHRTGHEPEHCSLCEILIEEEGK